MPVPLLVVRWQSFGSPPEEPELVVLLDGLPALLVEPVVLLSVAPSLVPLPFMLLPVPLLLPLVPEVLLPLPDVPPEVPPELPEDCAMTGAARVRARADVARILRNIGIASSIGAL